MKKIWYRLFPKYELTRTILGQWNISVSTDMFGNYKETKYCHFDLKYSKRLNKYKVSCRGYDPKNHGLYSIYMNEAIRLNSLHNYGTEKATIT